MEKKYVNHRDLLEQNKEYRYSEIFDLYENYARKFIKEENSKIQKMNKKNVEETDKYNEEQFKKIEPIIIQHKKQMNLCAIQIILLTLIFSTVSCTWLYTTDFHLFFLILFMILSVAVSLFLSLIIGVIFLCPEEKSPKFEKKNPKVLPLLEQEVTFIPSGTVQCSNCGTTTRIETKTRASICPNCKSETIIICEIEDNVTIKCTKSVNKSSEKEVRADYIQHDKQQIKSEENSFDDIPEMIVLFIEAGAFDLSQVVSVAKKENKQLLVLGNCSPAFNDVDLIISEAKSFKNEESLVLSFEKHPNRIRPMCIDPLIIVRCDFLTSIISNINAKSLGEFAIKLSIEASKKSLKIKTF